MPDAVQILIDAGAGPDKARQAVDGLARAIERIRALDQKRVGLRPDVEVIRELQSETPVSELSREALLALDDSARINGLIRGDDDVRNLKPDQLAALRVTAVATIEAHREQPPNPISAGANSGAKITRRGRPADFSGHDIACAAYVCFYDVTGIIPKRRTDAYAGGMEYGPFRDFMTAIMQQAGISGNVDWMLRGACEWMQDDNGQPNQHESRHFRNLLN